MTENENSIDIKDWKSLTLGQLIRRLSLGSWVLIVTFIVVLSGAMFGLGKAFPVLPVLPTVIETPQSTTSQDKDGNIPRDEHDTFSDLYGNIVNWKTLQALARGIAEHQPDGLETSMDIAASMLSQLRSSGGTASFLFGVDQLTMTATIAEDEISFEWDERPSLIPGIAEDAGYTQLSPEDLKEVNANLNRNGFAYLDADMEHAVIYRNIDGTLSLTLWE